MLLFEITQCQVIGGLEVLPCSTLNSTLMTGLTADPAGAMIVQPPASSDSPSTSTASSRPVFAERTGIRLRMHVAAQFHDACLPSLQAGLRSVHSLASLRMLIVRQMRRRILNQLPNRVKIRPLISATSVMTVIQAPARTRTLISATAVMTVIQAAQTLISAAARCWRLHK